MHKLMGVGRGVVAGITGKRKEVERLMSDASNLQKVQECMKNYFPILVIVFKELGRQVQDLLPEEEEKAADLRMWFEAKMLTARKWMDALSERKQLMMLMMKR